MFSIFPALRRDLAFNDTTLGLIATAFTWVYPISMPFSGRVADMIRRDRLVVASLSAAVLKTSAGMAGLMQWAAAGTMLAAAVLAIVVRRNFHADRQNAGYAPDSILRENSWSS